MIFPGYVSLQEGKPPCFYGDSPLAMSDEIGAATQSSLRMDEIWQQTFQDLLMAILQKMRIDIWWFFMMLPICEPWHHLNVGGFTNIWTKSATYIWSSASTTEHIGWFAMVDPRAWGFSWGKPAVRSLFQARHRRCRRGWAVVNPKTPRD